MEYQGIYKCLISNKLSVQISTTDLPHLFKWSDSNGNEFKLNKTSDPLKLSINSDSSYYNENFKDCIFEVFKTQIIRLKGPWDYPYEKELYIIPLEEIKYIEGFYKNYVFNDFYNNPWHSIVIKRHCNGIYYWSNDIGISWSLKYKHKKNDAYVFEIGKECPFYKLGFKKCRFFKDKENNNWILSGNNELFVKKNGIIEEETLSTPRLDVFTQFPTEISGNIEEKKIKINDYLILEGYYEYKPKKEEFFETEIDENLDWNFVTLKIDLDENDEQFLYWNNRAGRSWKLIHTHKKWVFEVDSCCPFFEKGFKKTVFQLKNGKIKALAYNGKVFKKINTNHNECHLI